MQELNGSEQMSPCSFEADKDFGQRFVCPKYLETVVNSSEMVEKAS